MLAGDFERLEERIQALRTEQAKVGTRLASLDATMAHLDECVAPTAGGVVRANARYGERGALTRFIVQLLQEAAPGARDTVDIAHRCAVHFGLTFDSRAAFNAFRSDTVGYVLRMLRRTGRAELLGRGVGRYAPNRWRWTSPESSLATLRVARNPDDRKGSSSSS